MKKIVPLLLIFCALYLTGTQIRSSRKSFLKKETYAKFLKKEQFHAKFCSPLPQWMKEQLDEDFAPYEKIAISPKRIEATFAKIREEKRDAWIVRYRILNNRLYRHFEENEPISLQDNSTELALKTLLELRGLPDMDFILSFYDGVTPDDRYYIVSEDLQAPILFSAKVKGAPHVILIPDWRSIGQWWVDDIKNIQSRVSQFPWEKKREFAVWRGSLTKAIRRKLCQIGKLHPQYLDAKFNYEENPQVKQELIQEGLFGGRVSWEEFLECKYLPLMDGVTCAAPAFQWRLLSNSVILKPDSNEVQWFYRDLMPYVHYIPVKSDLSDLIEQLDWAKAHDSQCKEIADRATRFAQENLLYEDVLFYFAQVLIRYANIQSIDSCQLAQEIQKDPRWISIQHRKKLKKKGERYSPHPTPF